MRKVYELVKEARQQVEGWLPEIMTESHQYSSILTPQSPCLMVWSVLHVTIPLCTHIWL